MFLSFLLCVLKPIEQQLFVILLIYNNEHKVIYNNEYNENKVIHMENYF